MAAEENISMETIDIQGGKITFAPEVIATIASIAASEVEGVEGMSGTMVEGITGMLNKKNITKGIKVEINDDSALIDINVILRYGYKIHQVAVELQKNIKTTIENMTGLKVAAINVFVQSVAFDKPEKAEPKVEIEGE